MRWGRFLLSVSGLAGFALCAVLLAGLLLATSSTAADDPFAEERAAMMRAVAETTDETAEWIGKTELSPRVMEAMGRVPRHLFVPPDLQDMGYLNRPLPIGFYEATEVKVRCTLCLEHVLSPLVCQISGASCRVGTLLAWVARPCGCPTFIRAVSGADVPDPSPNPACCGHSVPEAGPFYGAASFSPVHGRPLTTRPSAGRSYCQKLVTQVSGGAFG